MTQFVLVLMIGAIVGFVVGWLSNMLISNKKMHTIKEELIATKATFEAETRANSEKVALISESKEQLKLELNEISNKIFEAKTKEFEEKSQKNIENILKPFALQIKEFEKKVEEESKERFHLAKELSNLQSLNEKLSTDAQNLTKALKGDSKTQGIWGEMILEKLLEDSGLIRGREYEVQKSIKEDGEIYRPDAIVYLPDEKDVIIDAKVSLTAYERLASSDSEEGREQHRKDHALSVMTHIDQLSKKRYEKLAGVRSLDFVVLFMPIESAYLEALRDKPELFKVAYEKGVLIAGPATLMLTLRIIENIWRRDDQSKNAKDIAQKAGDLYDKFVLFVEELTKLGSEIDKSKASYDKVLSHIQDGRGNLIRRALHLKELGVKSKKELPNALLQKVELEE